MSELLKVDDAWAPGSGVWVNPFDGWGYMETIDGKLAPPFELAIEGAGVDTGGGFLGWIGSVSTPGHKYSGMRVQMNPRHTHWSGIVVIWVGRDEETAFSGMAETRGLECDWL